MPVSESLRHLGPGWYAIVMGLAGLSLAWHRAEPRMGDWAGVIAWGFGAAAAASFTLLAVATLWRAHRHPDAWADDRRHPVRHVFIAALPVAVILLATVAVVELGPSLPARLAWWAGAAAQAVVTLWVLARWLRTGSTAPGAPNAGVGGPGPGLAWASVTPALFIPIVGHVLVPLAGVPLGHTPWAAAQFGFGLLFWPVVLALIAVRLAVQGPWPERLRPTVFILAAPPAVVGLSLLQLGATPLIAFACWGMAVGLAAWGVSQLRAIAAQPFGLPQWGMSFPLAALAALTLRLADLGLPGTAVLAVLGPISLALATLVIVGLSFATLRGLRAGTLLVPEPIGIPVSVTGSGPTAASGAR
jgi:tellurite resistance protein